MPWTDEDYKRMGMTPPGKGKKKEKKPSLMTVEPEVMAEVEEETARRKKVLRGLGVK